MGDQVGQSVGGKLIYIDYREFERVRALRVAPERRADLFADMCRLNALYMIARAGSGHIGSSFSSLDILSWLFLEELNWPTEPNTSGDVFFSSKGHDAPGCYAALMGIGRLPFDLLHKLRRIDGLPGHPDVSTPGIESNTGSLGMGISKAKGMVLARRLMRQQGRVFVMTGDGELQEGQFWESLIYAANHGLHEIIAIIDHNKLQSDTFVKNVSDLGDLEAKLRAFGWRVGRCSGHDVTALASALAAVRADADRPKIIIADTVKGRGVSFMEHTALDSDVAMYRFHSGAPDADSYRIATQEIIERIQAQFAAIGAPPVVLETVERSGGAAPPPPSAQRLVPAYTRALLDQAQRHSDLVVLDADLILDTGLIPFRDRFPERFFECGIAEQDMVSVAGGMALKGVLPVVHSFACFLSARPNEQIYNNATEGTRVVYVGSLAGVVPGGPGHSHQAVRDISSLGGIPNLTLVEPSCEAEVGMLFDWCVNEAPGSSYLRLNSLAWEIPYELPIGYRVRMGHGVALTDGNDAVIFAYGPGLLSVAVHAARVALERDGARIKVVNLPWLNFVDPDWLISVLDGAAVAISLDNHFRIGGQGDRIADIMARHTRGVSLKRLALESIPKCGTNEEVLGAHKLDVAGVLGVLSAAMSTISIATDSLGQGRPR